jgi:hypothetical protein
MAAHCGPSAIRQAAGFGVFVTFVVAVAADIFAGEHPLHTVTLGLVVLAVSAMRLRHGRRYAGLFAALRAAIVAQPVLHAVTKLLPASPEPAVDPLGHAVIETSTSALHVLLAAVIVAGVAGAEQLALAMAALHPFARWLWLLLVTWTAARPQPPAPGLAPQQAPPTRRPHLALAPRRGPPMTAEAAAL